jgi:hypothetical protein
MRRTRSPIRAVRKLQTTVCSNQPNENLAGRTKGFHPSGAEDEQLIHAFQYRRSLRYDHDGDPLFLRSLKRVGQGLLARCVEIRIWFIEHDQRGLAKKCASECDALLLTS